MAGFRFRLGVVERVRKQAVDASRRELAEAISELSNTQEKIDRVQRTLDESASEIRAVFHGAIDVNSMIVYQVHRQNLARRLVTLGEERRHRELELARKRSELAEAKKRLQVIEKLHEKQWQRFQLETKRREQAESDEAAVQRFVRLRDAV